MKKKIGHKIPEINSSASADVSFLLLIFFILTASVHPDFIMPMHLSPLPPENYPVKHIEIKKRNFLPIYIDDENQIFLEKKKIEVNELKTLAKEFISNPENKENLPEKTEEEIPLLGKQKITKDHVIAITNGDKTSFQTYVFVQNELAAAYRELRNELSEKSFGKPYSEINSEEKKAIRQYYPRKISKPEKVEKGGKS